MEDPYTWIVGDKAKNEIAIRSDKDGVAAHWHSRECDVVVVIAFVVGRASDDLEVMSVEMERVLPRIEIVKDNVNNLVLTEDKGMRIDPVDLRLCCVCACGEDCEESRNFWSHVCYSIKKSTKRMSVSAKSLSLWIKTY